MEWAAYLVLASVLLFACVFIVHVRKRRDEAALQEEVEQDFKEEFACDESGELTEEGMEDMLDWLDEQDSAERMEGIEEVEGSDKPLSPSS
ncbi:MAG: hypothetical protein CMI32_07160 [Opitutales bacterium]|nr:hypothetical protein [Opitutales bacterium]|tara:strand:- start:225 stop:497 length:273 start_codon:yes stop_codon:yes gene_type:complete